MLLDVAWFCSWLHTWFTAVPYFYTMLGGVVLRLPDRGTNIGPWYMHSFVAASSSSSLYFTITPVYLVFVTVNCTGAISIVFVVVCIGRSFPVFLKLAFFYFMFLCCFLYFYFLPLDECVGTRRSLWSFPASHHHNVCILFLIYKKKEDKFNKFCNLFSCSTCFRGLSELFNIFLIFNFV